MEINACCDGPEYNNCDPKRGGRLVPTLTMLGIQAKNLQEQERLWKNNIKLQLREILEAELNFYQSAFQNIANCASILGGFAFACVAMDPFSDADILNGVESHEAWLVAGSFFIVLSLGCTVVCLLVVSLCSS